MTAAELEAIHAIRELKARYCRLVDLGAADAFAALFVPDGVWEVGAEVRGRGAIRARVAASSGQRRHVVANGVVDVAGDRARGTWHVLAARGEQWVGGSYDDTFALSADGWLFERVSFRQALTRSA